MALLGSGFVPSAGSVATELLALTRRAYIPSVVVQVGKATPSLSAFLANAEPVTGGLSPITQPVQGAAMTVVQNTDIAGSFGPVQFLAATQNAEFNLCSYAVGVPFGVLEGLLQLDASIVPVGAVRMHDAGTQLSLSLSTDLWVANASTLATWSIPDIIATADPARGAFGNLPRATNAFWQGTVKAMGAVNPTRSTVIQNLLSCIKGGSGEMPTCAFASLGTWGQLALDFVGQETFLVEPGKSFVSEDAEVQSAFTALSVSGVPIYADAAVPDGQINYLNFNYLQTKIHEQAAFAVVGPESLLPAGQLAYVVVVLLVLQHVCTKPAAQLRATGYNFLAV